MQTIAQFLAQELLAAGVKTVFGLPGGENVEVLDAIREVGIDFILVKNESSACFMADAAARLTGKPGVALTTLGPGATNAYVGLAHAYLERSPVLLVTAQTDPRLIGTHTHQALDLQACFRPITKLTAEIDEYTPVSTIRHALHTLQSGRPGPVHLGICDRVAQMPIVVEPVPNKDIPRSNTIPDVSAARNLIEKSKRPIILTGLGLEPEKPYQEIQALAETLNAPLIDTPKSKGALSANHPLFAGTLGLTRTDPVYTLLDESDCIIAVGFDVVELVKPWDQPQPLLWIANWDNHDPRIPAVHEFVGAIAPVLNSLSDVRASSDPAWGKSRIDAFHAEITAQDLPQAAPDRILPQDVLRIIRENTPEEIFLTTDVGSHKIFTALNWQAQAPNHYMVSNGLSAMGFGVTSAIAAALVTGETTIAITGDGGFSMILGELALLKQYDLPLILIVMNDSALDLIRSAQRRKGKSVFGTEFTNPDYEQIAAAYRIAYSCVQNQESCVTAIKKAIQARKPALIEMMVDPISYPTTPR